MIFKQGVNPNLILFNDLIKVFYLNKQTNKLLVLFYLLTKLGLALELRRYVTVIVDLCMVWRIDKAFGLSTQIFYSDITPGCVCM